MNLSEITVIVPVWQCTTRLQKHLEVVRRLADAGCSTVWVASQSDDNSHLIAHEEAEKTGGRYFLTPRGLYNSWNKGIKESRTPYTYISTVGESILPEGLAHLWDVNRKVEADIVFSPPLLSSNERDRRQILQWPVFKNAKKLRMFDHRVLPTNLIVSIQATAAFSCLLGSFSSCLCRTKFMQSYPFPTRFNHYGDTGWFCLNLSRSRVAYSVRAVADFQFHDAPKRMVNSAHHRVFLRSLTRHLNHEKSFFLRLVLQRYSHYMRYLDLKRGAHPKRYWYLSPKVFYVRILRGLCEGYIKARSFYLAKGLE